MNKILVVGDLHLDDKYPRYLEEQCNTLRSIVEKEKPTHLVLLGDVFHYRAPKPAVLLALQRLLNSLKVKKEILVLRGNHDSASKSDDCETVLSLYNNEKVKIYFEPYFFEELNLYFIPHYEHTETIVKMLGEIEKVTRKNKPSLRVNGPVVFGHFGYNGCLNSVGINDFLVEKKHFQYQTILGHIHKFNTDENITVLGTPWSTSFGECDHPHYYAILTGDGLKPYKTTYHEIDFGIRHYVIQYEALEANKDEIKNPKYKTILRVLISKFDPDGILANPSDLRKKILKEYGVLWVDLKFQPVLTDKYSGQSSFIPGNDLSDIDDKVISQYIEENKSSIPNEDLMKLLNEIKEHKNP